MAARGGTTAEVKQEVRFIRKDELTTYLIRHNLKCRIERTGRSAEKCSFLTDPLLIYVYGDNPHFDQRHKIDFQEARLIQRVCVHLSLSLSSASDKKQAISDKAKKSITIYLTD